jgi:hypothetical protein
VVDFPHTGDHYGYSVTAERELRINEDLTGVLVSTDTFAKAGEAPVVNVYAAPLEIEILEPDMEYRIVFEHSEETYAGSDGVVERAHEVLDCTIYGDLLEWDVVDADGSATWSFERR